MTKPATSVACDVSILIVGFRSRAFLAKAIGSIGNAASQVAHEVRFVNNSDDDSEQQVIEQFPSVIVVPSRGNIGFGAGNNYLAQGAKGRFLLMLNPDTVLEPNAVDILAAAAEAAPEFDILGGLSVDQNGQGLAPSRLEFPTLGSILRGIIGQGSLPLPDSQSSAPVPVDSVSGAFLLIRREVWDRLGGFDERFFLYAEELDLCRRLIAQGGKVGIVPQARVLHDISSGEPHSPSRVLYSMRGAATFYRKHFSPPYAFACLLAHWASCFGRFAVGGLLSPFSPRYAAISRGMREVSLCPWLWMRGYPKVRTPG